LLFIVYGSLVPLDFNPRPLDDAWQAFLGIQYFALGVDSRADWIANGVLYLPLAYLLSAALGARHRPPLAKAILASIVFLFCASVAVGVEFTQLFFPPRTVSMNDLIAELIGSLIGIVVCLIWGGKLGRLRTEMLRGGTGAIRAAAVIYLLAYVSASLFPYDFYISAAEFSQKFNSDTYGWLLAPASCERFTVCGVRLLAETIIVIPLGILLSLTLGEAARRPKATAFWCGLALGLVMEVTQLFMASGVSQGLSLLTRAAGLALGVTLHRRSNTQWLAKWLPYVGPLLALLCAPYLLALMWLSGWFSAAWGGIERAGASLDTVNWIPFYYHYYTTEQGALRSLLVNAAMYMPLGFGYWAWTIRRSSTYSNGTALIPALIAAPLAGILESGKLFVQGKHADPTDVLIAAFAAAGAYLFAVQAQRWSLQETAAPAPETVQRLPATGSHGITKSMGARPLIAALLLAGVGWALLHYPLSSLWALMALALYAAVIWRYPHLSLPSVLALLPVLNFSPWSGWILLNELDLFIAVALAVRLLQPPSDSNQSPLLRGGKFAIALLAASYVISTLAGLLPLPPFDQNTLVSYFGGLNSLRVLKGFAWALALLPLALEDARQAQHTDRRLATGMLIGLCAVVAAALWERAVFSGLMDFSSDYRLEGPFPELHTGGGDINAYLVMIVPFVLWWTTLRPTVIRLVLGAALFTAASYAMAVTFTRGGYVGYGGALLVLAITAVTHALRARATPAATVMAVAVAGMAVAGATGMLAIASSPFMEARVAASKADAGTRTGHWQRAYDMMDPNLTTTLLGMGLGNFPGTLLVKQREAASATFSYPREAGNSFVRLGSGRALYLDQRVPMAGGKRYTLSVDLRSPDPKAGVSVSLCEKSLQASFACERVNFNIDAPGSAWQRKTATVNADSLGSRIGLLQRPVALSLSNAQRDGVIDVDNVRLIDSDGRDLISNGDFSMGGARWFFTADDHMPWHIFNLWVQILFEQGAFGILAFAIVAGISLINLMRRTWQGDWFSGSLLAGLTGFLLIGLTESLFDGPRVTTLFFLLLFLGLRRAPQNASAPGK
jgi:VanZ family protein